MKKIVSFTFGKISLALLIISCQSLIKNETPHDVLWYEHGSSYPYLPSYLANLF
jgi:hypothetical protein